MSTKGRQPQRTRRPQPDGSAPKVAPAGKPLRDEEWKFEAVGDDELDACFYYEFARSSDLIRKGVQSWRGACQKRLGLSLDKVKSAFQSVPQSQFDRLRFVADHAEFEAAYDADFGRKWCRNDDADKLRPASLSKVDPTILNFVAEFTEFPRCPWQLVPNAAKKQRWAEAFRTPDRARVAEVPEMAVADSTELLRQCHAHGLSAWERVNQILAHPANARIKPGMHLFSLSWNYRNEEIAAAVEAWCKDHRPPEYQPEPAAMKKMLGTDWSKLPFGKRAGLAYLGVWRRREACGKKPWKKFFSVERWAPAAFVENVRARRAAREKLLLKDAPEYDEALCADAFNSSDNIIRDLQDKCAKAESFIAQLEGRPG